MADEVTPYQRYLRQQELLAEGKDKPKETTYTSIAINDLKNILWMRGRGFYNAVLSEAEYQFPGQVVTVVDLQKVVDFVEKYYATQKKDYNRLLKTNLRFMSQENAEIMAKRLAKYVFRGWMIDKKGQKHRPEDKKKVPIEAEGRDLSVVKVDDTQPLPTVEAIQPS